MLLFLGRTSIMLAFPYVPSSTGSLKSIGECEIVPGCDDEDVVLLLCCAAIRFDTFGIINIPTRILAYPFLYFVVVFDFFSFYLTSVWIQNFLLQVSQK